MRVTNNLLLKSFKCIVKVNVCYYLFTSTVLLIFLGLAKRIKKFHVQNVQTRAMFQGCLSLFA